MPVRFNAAQRPPHHRVLEYKLGKPHVVFLGAEPAFHRDTPLHWLPAQSRTVPCLHEDCPWHHLPARHCVYVPCQAYDAQSRLWKFAVLPILDSMADFLLTDYVGKVYKIGRYRYKNEPPTIAVYEKMPTHSVVFPGFDVESSLYHMWGEFTNYRQKPARLFVDERGEQKEGVA